MKITDFNIGSTIEVALVVKSATAKKTRSGKPYLTVELFDGRDTIYGNYWEWSSGNVPEPNAILTVTASVTEWQGAKQLNISAMRTCTDKHLSEFIPTSDYDVAETYKQAYAMIMDVNDDVLRTVAIALLEELREQWLTAPGAILVHHNFAGGALVHSYNVARIAAVIADTMGENVNKDLVVVGAMMHDIGKLFTYRINGINIDKTMDGRLYEHLFIGAEFIGNFADSHVDTDNPTVSRKIRLLRHIILSHHGSLEFGSPVTPMCIEAYIVHHADHLDATYEQLRVVSRNTPVDKALTEKLWTLNSSPHLTYNYVAEVML